MVPLSWPLPPASHERVFISGPFCRVHLRPLLHGCSASRTSVRRSVALGSGLLDRPRGGSEWNSMTEPLGLAHLALDQAGSLPIALDIFAAFARLAEAPKGPIRF